MGHSISNSFTTAILAQKKVVRIITFSHYLAHTQPLFQSLSILPVDKLILNQIGIVMYKYCNGLLPNVMNRLYMKNKDIHSHNTRNNNLLRIHRDTANFTNLSARVLTRNLNVYVAYHIFKLKLKLYLMNNSLELKYSKKINNMLSYDIFTYTCTFILYSVQMTPD